MPATVPPQVRAAERALRELATTGSPVQQRFLKTVAKELRPELRRMYETSTDPFGGAWTRKKNGRPAYQSKKMGNAVSIKPSVTENGAVHVRFLVQWLEAADKGHTFPPQHIGANQRYLSFNRKGRLVREGDLYFRKGKRAGQLKKGVYQRFARQHVIGPRVLPPRQQQPNGRMPDEWGEAVNRGSQQGMADALARVTSNG